VDLWGLRVEAQRLAIFTYRFVSVALLQERDAQIVVSLSVPRVDAQRFAKLSDRLV